MAIDLAAGPSETIDNFLVLDAENSVLIRDLLSGDWYRKSQDPTNLCSAQRQIAELELSEFERLPDGWDGEGAERINSRTIANVRAGLCQICSYAPVPELVPNVNGTISMEWETDFGYAHLEIGTRSFSFLLQLNGKAPAGMMGETMSSFSGLGNLIRTTLYPDVLDWSDEQELTSLEAPAV